jgi:hypothetical protein
VDLFKQYKLRIWMSAVNPASVVNPAGLIQIQPPSAIGPGAILHSGAGNTSMPVGLGFGSNVSNNNRRSQEQFGMLHTFHIHSTQLIQPQVATVNRLPRTHTRTARIPSHTRFPTTLLSLRSTWLPGLRVSSFPSRCLTTSAVSPCRLAVTRTLLREAAP